MQIFPNLPKRNYFRKKRRIVFLTAGIAEGNMIGIAAGFAAAGKIPFAQLLAMFAAGRAFEQIRNSVGYPHLTLKFVQSMRLLWEKMGLHISAARTLD